MPWGNVKPGVGSILDLGDPINQGLVGCWLFNEGAGGFAYDIARMNNGTLTGGTAWAIGRFGKTLSFDGSNDYISVPSISIPTDITVSAWIFPLSLNANYICTKNPVNEQWALFVESELLIWRGGANQNVLTATGPSINMWHHVVGSQRGVDGQLYIDGVQVATTSSLTAIGNGAGLINIGRFDAQYHFNGSIDNVRIHNRALTPAEVMRLYSEPFAGIVAPRRAMRSQVAGAAAAAAETLRTMTTGMQW